MDKLKMQPVLPIYAIGLVWVIFTLIHPLYRVSDYTSVILISAMAFVVVKSICLSWKKENKATSQDCSSPAASPEATDPSTAGSFRKEQAPAETLSPEKLESLMKEKERALQEMHRLNRTIQSEILSDQICQLEDATVKIFDYADSCPETLPQVRRFMVYYLPTTLKLLNTYHRMDAAEEDDDKIMKKIETTMFTIVSAFHQLSDALSRGEPANVASDITIMENLLVQEGLI